MTYTQALTFLVNRFQSNLPRRFYSLAARYMIGAETEDAIRSLARPGIADYRGREYHLSPVLMEDELALILQLPVQLGDERKRTE